jgi:CheY-like chemotaxis protein
MRILVVDDEPLVARTVSLLFSKRGYDVATCHGADAALADAITTRPDLILCDINMPGRDGIALMEDLGRELPDCPILVLTGFHRALARVDACAAHLQQPVRVLTKPCPPVELLREADTLLHLV